MSRLPVLLPWAAGPAPTMLAIVERYEDRRRARAETYGSRRISAASRQEACCDGYRPVIGPAEDGRARISGHSAMDHACDVGCTYPIMAPSRMKLNGAPDESA